MFLVYDSWTRNVERFVNKLALPEDGFAKVSEHLQIDEPYILITFTTGFGQVPKSTSAFLERNSRNMVGVIASGNRNWGENFGKAADIISETYNVPILAKFELSGKNSDVENIKEILKKEKYDFLSP